MVPDALIRPKGPTAVLEASERPAACTRAKEETAGDGEEEVEKEVGSVVIVVVVVTFPADASGVASTFERECCCVVDAREAES